MSVGSARKRGDRIIARGRPVPLPPAGDERREELRKRDDELAEAGETLASETGMESIDPSKLKVDNEIATLFDSRHALKISGLQRGYVYKLASVRQDGQQIDDAKQEGYEVVSGDAPEARERMGVGGDTTRHFGDCILMRIRKDQWIALKRRRRDVASRLRTSITGPLIELGRMTEARFGRNLVHTDVNDPLVQRAISGQVRTEVAKQLADRKFDQQLREGTVGR